jgi:predicted nucleic acid-binding protein
MKVAVTDACIFIDLCDLQLITHFFSMELEIHTTVDIMNELHTEQQQILKVYKSVNKLTVHIIKEEDLAVIDQKLYPRGLTDSDRSVLYIAQKTNALLLSSDKLVRNTANVNAIEYHGMLWIFDRLIERQLLAPLDAVIKLKQLINTNIVFQNNKMLVAEMDKRLKRWGA